MQNTLSSALPTKAPVKLEPKVRLNYLHGIRGLAALYVVLFHIRLDYQSMLSAAGVKDLPLWISIPFGMLSEGHAAVVIFILLSGYCLMLPVIKSADKQLRGGFWGYLKRRAWRIIPPYYATIFLSLLVTASIPVMMSPDTGWHWNSGQPSFNLDVVLSHLFLVHNIRPEWMFKLNPPLWSVGLEWQIYLLFPVLLLPVWRRFGVVALLAAAFGLSVVLNGMLPFSGLITLFALGMLGAIVGFSQEEAFVKLRKKLPWSQLSLFFFLGFVALAAFRNDAGIVKDLLIGISTLCLIISYTRRLTEERGTPSPSLLRLLESKSAFTLGLFSYSLYLTHAPVLALYELALNNLPLSIVEKGFFLFTVGPVLVVSMAYGFHVLFERHFMSEYAPKR
jgi:peptidoglycan/LPS O-acetylase OafA/YrhL